jgi:hypothetical protein
MSEEELVADAAQQKRGPVERHRFLAMIILIILVASALVGVAMALYASSGAAQLDLTRPGYVSVRDQAVRSNQFDGFSASGSIDETTLDAFKILYTEQANKATGIESFGGDVMSDKALSIDTAQAE